MTGILTLNHLQHLWPHGDQHVAGLIEGIAASADGVFAKYDITSTRTVAIIMGQFSEECGAGLEMAENGNYTAQRLLQVFPTHFNATMAQNAAHNPKRALDIAYGGRMGNARPPSDDGYNFRGRGLSQVTGRDGYTALQKELTKQNIDIDILSNFDLVSSPEYALICGMADFVLCGCLPPAERGDILGTTKRLNGGYNGLAERQRWTALWKSELGV